MLDNNYDLNFEEKTEVIELYLKTLDTILMTFNK